MPGLRNPEIFRAVLESLQTGVCMVDRERKIMFWNDGAEKITGYLRQDVLGRFCGEVLLLKFREHKVVLCERFCPLLVAMRDGRARKALVYLHHKLGYAVPVSLQAVSIRDGRGHVIGAAESFVEMPCGSTRPRPECDLAVGHGLDPVTQLPDYAYTESHLAGRLKFAAEHSIPFAVLCIQLDQLDSLRATHGSDAAEALLNVAAHTLRNGLDSQDFLGRWTEDRFLAIIANYENGALSTTAERLKRLAQSCEVTWWGDLLSVTVSLGGTVLIPPEAMQSFLERTGNALKQAVAAGGNFAVVLDAPESL